MIPASLYRRIYSGVNYRLRNVASGRWAHHCRPTSIICLLTERCNAKCLHCSIWQNTGPEASPTLDQWKRVVTDIRQWLGPVQITFSGGEALIKPFTIDLVSHGSSLGLFVEILTHGYWEDQTKIERLAKARPSRITISFDGIGETHTRVRGRPRFWERTSRTIATLQSLQKELHFAIRLKNVVMSHNLQDTIEVAKYANQQGMDVFYQAIEQNYNTPEDAEWYLHSDNWPKDTAQAVENIRQLIRLKEQGYHIANSVPQLEAMIAYFQNPGNSRVAIMFHSAHEARRSCVAMTNLQLQANGDVTTCTGVPPVGNIKVDGIREIWERRPRLWEGGCCLEKRCSTGELSHTVPASSLTTTASTWNTPSSLTK